MTYYLTFVAADTSQNALDRDFVSFLKDEGYETDDISWLCPTKALDLPLEKSLTHNEVRSLRNRLRNKMVDVFLTPAESRKKKMLLADMDSTIVVGETLDELASFAGVKAQVEEITKNAMNGLLDFEQAIKERVGLLKNLPIEALEETARAVQLMPGAESLVRVMKKNGAKTILVTGGFMFFAEDVKANAGFDFVHGNRLEIEADVLTGNVIPPILDKSAKLAYLKDYAQKFQIDHDQIMAIGDGANDLPMLEAAGLGIGYHPKPLLEEKLMNIILHGNLTAALYAQGYQGTFEQ